MDGGGQLLWLASVSQGIFSLRSKTKGCGFEILTWQYPATQRQSCVCVAASLNMEGVVLRTQQSCYYHSPRPPSDQLE